MSSMLSNTQKNGMNYVMKACVTGITLGKAVGLGHSEGPEAVLPGKSSRTNLLKPMTPEFKKCLEYGSQNEVFY